MFRQWRHLSGQIKGVSSGHKLIVSCDLISGQAWKPVSNMLEVSIVVGDGGFELEKEGYTCLRILKGPLLREVYFQLVVIFNRICEYTSYI